MARTVEKTGEGFRVAPDVLCLPVLIVNVCLVGYPGSGDWTLVDAALWNSAARIRDAAQACFGLNIPPRAIILTHGHFDHVGAVAELAQEWDVPVYSHPEEMPYLSGQRDYPPPDPTVDSGLMAKLSPLFPNESIDLGSRLKSLPPDGSVPSLPGWRWVHTPGHTPGHISLFRDSDRVLIAGDAFTTVEQESALAVLIQEKELHGPPKYFTTDWSAAKQSVSRLKELNPSVVITGHGVPLQAPRLSEDLDALVADFNHLAVPEHGRYVQEQDQNPRF